MATAMAFGAASKPTAFTEGGELSALVHAVKRYLRQAERVGIVLLQAGKIFAVGQQAAVVRLQQAGQLAVDVTGPQPSAGVGTSTVSGVAAASCVST